ncbi:MAG: BNR/Asp-box repeat-containing protein [Parcubacteria group bacterium Gr01-1014_29]|nr:MAG: BNR/Asp-box repeat-containing protein [Parcubacteria group bacterium Gr01-1014_29]
MSMDDVELKGNKQVLPKGDALKWHFWFLVSFSLLLVVLIGGLFLSSLRKQETNEQPLPTSDAPGPLVVTSREGDQFLLWLKVPSYAPPASKYVTRIFSGRKFVITPASPISVEGDMFLISEKNSSSKISLSHSPLEGAEGGSAFVIEIPGDVETGAYILSFASSGGVWHTLPLTIEGLNSNELLKAEDFNPYESLTAQVLDALTPLQKDVVVFRSVVCRYDGDCYWEMVFGGNPNDPKELIVSNKQGVRRSTDAGRTWSDEEYSQIGAAPIRPVEDSRLGFFKDGSFAHTSHAIVQNESGEYIKTGSIVTGRYAGNVEASLFNKLPSSPDKYPPIQRDWLIDFPVLAIDPNTDAIYITTNSSWFEDTRKHEYAFYTSHDKGKTFKKYPLRYTGGAIKSLTVGIDGTLYAIKTDFRSDSTVVDYTMLRFSSVDPPVFEEIPTPAIFLGGSMRTFQGSSRGLSTFDSAEIVADTHEGSPHRGRLHLVWTQEKKVVPDPKFEYGLAGYDYNVFASFTDDRGTTWSQPVRINDDKGEADQFAFGPRVDELGRLHVVFLDHRRSPTKPFLDVYYAYSSDGVHFSPNLRVNEAPIPITLGGRLLGDYLDMVVPYADRTYVVYPCEGQGLTGPTPVVKPRAACFAEIQTHDVRLDQGLLHSLGPLSVFLGLKNSDDIGTKFDIRAELLRNDLLLAASEKRCITGLSSGKSKEISILFDTLPETVLASGDTLSLKVMARIGTKNTNGVTCGGHASGTLRFSYGGQLALARVALGIDAFGIKNYFLMYDGTEKLSQHISVDEKPRLKDIGVSVSRGNPWRDIGVWNISVK